MDGEPDYIVQVQVTASSGPSTNAVSIPVEPSLTRTLRAEQRATLAQMVTSLKPYATAPVHGRVELDLVIKAQAALLKVLDHSALLDGLYAYSKLGNPAQEQETA